MSDPANFDRIARAYRWLEYLTLGPLLERTRNRYLAVVLHRRCALLLGDGDGRFTARLLNASPDLRAHAVDTSRSMLEELRRRTGSTQRLRLTHGDALQLDAPKLNAISQTDLVVTHFFLDCLTQPQVDILIPRLTRTLAPGTLWLVSEFAVPRGLLRWPARIYIRLLYLAFRILTGLRTTHLPDFESPLRASGWSRIAAHPSLFGLLTSQLWSLQPPTLEPPANGAQHHKEI